MREGGRGGVSFISCSVDIFSGLDIFNNRSTGEVIAKRTIK